MSENKKGKPKKLFTKKKISERYSDAFKKAGGLKDLPANEKTQFFKNLYKQKMIDSNQSYAPDSPMKDLSEGKKSTKKSRPFGGKGGAGAGGVRFLRTTGPTRKM